MQSMMDGVREMVGEMLLTFGLAKSKLRLQFSQFYGFINATQLYREWENGNGRMEYLNWDVGM